MKNIKNVKNEDPCQRSATSLISEDATKIIIFKKKWPFCMGGVVKTENRLLFTKKHNMKGVLKNCKDVPCKITTFGETNANDIGCANVKMAILHGRS